MSVETSASEVNAAVLFSDPVSNVLKWILLGVAIVTFGMLGVATKYTYEGAPADIETGRSGFQRADLMDYGSLYGMGSYFGEDTPLQTSYGSRH